jgi:hypothetical protein
LLDKKFTHMHIRVRLVLIEAMAQLFKVLLYFLLYNLSVAFLEATEVAVGLRKLRSAVEQ